ncbi:MAG TPA: hypothetical protein ACFYD5_05660, partial [Candidatus Tripitaka sp. YC43]
GGDWANSIQQTSDGGYIVAGSTGSFGAGKKDAWVLKLGPDGLVEWQKTYGGVRGEGAESIQQTSDGGFIVAGNTDSFGAGKEDFWVLKLRPDGLVEWQKTYGGDGADWANSIQQTSDGGYIVAGYTGSFGAGEDDIWVLKLRADGAVEWQKTYGGGGIDWGLSIHETNGEGYVVAGWTDSFGAGGFDIWVLKLKTDGIVEWQKTYGGDYEDCPISIRKTYDGGYIMAGYTCSSGARGWKFPDACVLRLKPDGSIDPPCGFLRDTRIFGKDSSATVRPTCVNSRDSNAIPQDSSATVLDTDVSADFSFP